MLPVKSPTNDIMAFASRQEATQAAQRLSDAHSGIIKFCPILHPTRPGYALQAIDFIGRATYCQVQLVSGVAHCTSLAATGSAARPASPDRIGDQQHVADMTDHAKFAAGELQIAAVRATEVAA
jgi:NAD(P)H-dependent FMN reductase